MITFGVQSHKETCSKQPEATETTTSQQDCPHVANVPTKLDVSSDVVQPVDQKPRKPRPSRIPIRCGAPPPGKRDPQLSMSSPDQVQLLRCPCIEVSDNIVRGLQQRASQLQERPNRSFFGSLRNVYSNRDPGKVLKMIPIFFSDLYRIRSIYFLFTERM